MHRVEKGLVLRVAPYRDADEMLTILTECDGKITAAARGVRRKSSRISAAVQSLAYSEFTLYEAGGRFTVNEAEALELFFSLRGDLVRLACANYFAEVLDQAADEEVANPELLRLGLNALYALSRGVGELLAIKAAFELKIAAFSGYMPNLASCAQCGASLQEGVFDPRLGLCFCRACAHGGVPVTPGVLQAMQFILKSDVRRMFAFRLGEEGLRALADICEMYLAQQFDREFKTLTFYHSIEGLI